MELRTKIRIQIPADYRTGATFMKTYIFTVTAEVAIEAESPEEAKSKLIGRIYTLSDDSTHFSIEAHR